MGSLELGNQIQALRYIRLDINRGEVQMDPKNFTPDPLIFLLLIEALNLGLKLDQADE